MGKKEKEIRKELLKELKRVLLVKHEKVTSISLLKRVIKSFTVGGKTLS
tara:strand:- start:906 stop:1052 length:147 start_codon:yes stop_codon:yes gene_type:complete